MPISDGRVAVAARHRRELAPTAVIVPATKSLSNDCCESSGSIGSDERSIAAHTATPRSRRDCPRDRVAE
ncbi:MAG UNVERIFIED_CONTAM: hypothetical protein LVR18_24205 [Planctomycetaceae bacterium]